MTTAPRQCEAAPLPVDVCARPELPLACATEANAGPVAVASADLLPVNLLSGDEIVILFIKPSLWFVLFR